MQKLIQLSHLFLFLQYMLIQIVHGNYVKFKGLVEEELKRLNFSKLGILRPSFLMGKRKENRVGEKIGIFDF